MAGRGRGATLPAWMTHGNATTVPDSQDAYNNYPQGSSSSQFNDAARTNERSTRAPEPNYRERDRDGGNSKRSRSRSRDRDGGRRRDDSRDRNRDRAPARGHGGSGGSSAVGGSSNAVERTNNNWRPRKNKVSNFDVRPPEGYELPPIGVTATPNGIPNSYFSFTNNPLALAKEASASITTGGSGNPHGASVQKQTADISPHTRHARRIYAGGIPNTSTEGEVTDLFNRVISQALLPQRLDGPPVIKVYMNLEKAYAFVELPTIELTNACMGLDGMRWDHWTGPIQIRIRRPNDYKPELVPPNLGPIPTFNAEYLATIGVAAASSNAGKIFVGGLPYNLSDEQVMELLQAFGPLKSFHQVRDPGSMLSKGYAFCEYMSQAEGDFAIANLNDMPLGDRKLTVRYAANNTSAASATTSAGSGALGGIGIMGLPVTIPGVPQFNMPMSGSYNAPAPNTAPAPLQNNTLAMTSPTRVLKLSNMVTHNDLENDAEYADIKEDVRLECEDHGRVVSVIIPRVKDGFPPAIEGFIFVEFERPEGSRSAALALNGRKFSNRLVIVQYFDENRFAQRMLF